MNRLSFLEFVCFLKKFFGFLMEVFITTVLILKECSRTRDSAQEIASLSLSFDDREVESKCRGLANLDLGTITFVQMGVKSLQDQ